MIRKQCSALKCSTSSSLQTCRIRDSGATVRYDLSKDINGCPLADTPSLRVQTRYEYSYELGCSERRLLLVRVLAVTRARTQIPVPTVSTRIRTSNSSDSTRICTTRSSSSHHQDAGPRKSYEYT
eukprot:scaffold18151_cov34-Prasinocladus_malaysianus.AAC.1